MIKSLQKMVENHRSGYFSFMDVYETILDFPKYVRKEYDPFTKEYLFKIICSQYSDYGIGELTKTF